MRDRNLAGGPVVAATKKKKKKKNRRLESGRCKRKPNWWRQWTRAGVQKRNSNGRLDVDQIEEGDEEEEEAEEKTRNIGACEGADLEEEEDEATGTEARILRVHYRQDRSTTSWTGRPREFSW